MHAVSDGPGLEMLPGGHCTIHRRPPETLLLDRKMLGSVCTEMFDGTDTVDAPLMDSTISRSKAAVVLLLTANRL